MSLPKWINNKKIYYDKEDVNGEGKPLTLIINGIRYIAIESVDMRKCKRLSWVRP